MEGKPNILSHVGLWLVALSIVVWLVYSATHTSTENNRYAPGATVNDNHSSRWPLTFDFNFSCVSQGLSDKWGKGQNYHSTPESK